MFLKNSSDTILLGKNFAKKLNPKSIILLKGPIGAGKTSFVQGIGQGLSIKEIITSPTFALSHHYHSGVMPLIHMDLYRIENELSAKELFLEEEEELELNQGILIIEWPDLILPIVDNYWLIEISYADQIGRYFHISESKFSRN